MSKIGTIDFAGESGRMYTFNVYSIDNNQFKPKGGVYMITKRTEKSDGRPIHRKIFIGCAEDFSIAFLNHEKMECYMKEEANCICAYWEDSHVLREKVAEDLIDNYHPPCNE